MSKITIEDISRHTGLSRGTVSRALNNRPDISVQTKQRVLEACRELNYVPSHAARSLATGRCFAVAVVVDDLRTPFAAGYLRGVLASAQRERYAVHITELGPDPVSVIDHVCMVLTERVDSILLGTDLENEHAARLVKTAEARPLVTTGPLAGHAADVLTPDYTESGRLLARHVLTGNGPDMVYLHRPGTASADRSLAGFQEVCQEQGIDPHAVTINVGERGENVNELDARLASVRAVAATDDYLALDAMVRCRAAGRMPGQDVTIAGQGNSYCAARVTPALTTIDYSAEEIGRRAMDIAVQRVAKTRQDVPQETLIAPLLITRASSRVG
jgi:DNA-binding LacI/PurR family transcriptional regulator